MNRSVVGRSTTQRGGVAILAVLALAIAACGGDDDTEDAEDAAAPADDAADDDVTDEDEADAADEADEADEPDDADVMAEAEHELSFRLAHGYSESNPNVVGGIAPFMEQLVEEGAQRGIIVDIDYYPDQALASQAELFDAVRDGLADVGAMAMAQFSEEIPAITIGELPGRFAHAAVGGQTMLELMNTDLHDDFLALNMRPLFVMMLPPYQLFTVDDRILLPEDATGLDIRTAGVGCTSATEAIGANPIQIIVADQYVALERGTIDGVNGPLGNLRAYQVEEGTNHVTRNLALCSTANPLMVNEDWFQSLPDEVQQLLLDVGLETQTAVGDYLMQADDEAVDYYLDQGLEVNEVDLEPWEAALAGVEDEWVERMDDLGIDGRSLIDRWEQLRATYE